MNSAQPSLSALLTSYLKRQVSDQMQDLGHAEPLGRVVPFEAVPVQPVEPRLAWEEALAVLPHFQLAGAADGLAVPPDWPTLVAAHEPEAALPFCLGNFPQMVRQLPVLLQAPDLAPRRATAVSPLCPPSLRHWASQAAQKPPFLQTLLAVGVLRLARYHDLATELFRQHRGRVPADHRRAWANEEAALAWSCGQFEQAAALWQSQAESVPILFNRGLADLFLGRAAKARTWLIQATARLSDESAWYHLGHLYLALAEMRD